MVQPFSLAQLVPFLIKGCQLTSLMFGTEEEADNFLGANSQRDQFTFPSLKKSGWKMTGASALINLDDYRTVFDGLRGVEGERLGQAKQIDQPDDWQRSVLRQTEFYRPAGGDGEAEDVSYIQVRRLKGAHNRRQPMRCTIQSTASCTEPSVSLSVRTQWFSINVFSRPTGMGPEVHDRPVP